MEPPQQQHHSNLAATSPAPRAPYNASNTATATAAAAAAAANTTITITTTTTVPALASTATAISATTNAATAFSGTSVAHHNIQQTQHHYPSAAHAQLQQHNSSSTSSSLLGGLSATPSSAGGGSGGGAQQTIEKLSRPAAFDKMESLVREMQDPENGVPVRQQKMFLTSIPYAFMGYDLIEWLMDRLLIEESEALNIANQLCLHGYFFPVNDTKTLVVKDDSSLYRFQTPYYWPWQHKAPDNVEYAIYLAKRSLRNKQRHALEDYEIEALASLHKNLKGKWDFISMQAEEQVRLAKERKKGDKIVGDSQERAYWRVHRPPPGQFTPLEPCPVPTRDRQGSKHNKKKTIEDVQREVDYLKKTINRTRMKMSQACESLTNYSETFTEYDFFLQPALPSNPWVTEDTTFWQLNNTYVDIPTEKRVKRWAISIDELVSDPTGLQEFTNFLEKEYSHENIRFWIEVNRLRRSAHSQVTHKVNEIYEEFLKPGAPCEINIDGKTMESVLKGLCNPSRFTFDSASDHIYMLLLKKDCYPRFVRSDHYKRLLETGIQPSHKKRFFNFGGVSGAKKKMTAALSSQPNIEGSSAKSGGIVSTMMQAPPPGSLARRRGSDRSLTGSAHELAVIGVNKDTTSKVPHSHSQSNLCEMPFSESVYRGDMPTRMVAMDAGVYAAYGARDIRLQATQDTPKPKLPIRLETTIESGGSAVCPWDLPDEPVAIAQPPKQLAPITAAAQVQLSICPWEQDSGETTPLLANTKSASQRLTSTSSDISEVSERLQRSSLGIRHQNTVDSGEAGMKRLMPNFTEQRRASVSFTPSRISEYQSARPSMSKTASTPSPTVGSQIAVDTAFPPLFTPLAQSSGSITKETLSSASPSAEADVFAAAIKKLSLTEEAGSVLPTQRPLQPSNVAECSAATNQTATNMATSQCPSPVDAEIQEIQEVHIELIETSNFVDPGKSPQRSSLECTKVNSRETLQRAITPTINVEECAGVVTSSHSDSPSPKSPKMVTMPADDNLPGDETPNIVGNIPPPLPLVGPMEEEQMADDDGSVAQEELSPTTDEYQEGLQFGADSKDVYDYDIVDTDCQTGYIAPAPTPAPSMAPLAEIDIDTVEDEPFEEPLASPVTTEPVLTAVTPSSLPIASVEEVKKRRKKRNSESRKMASLEEKDKDNKATTSAAETGNKAGAERNTVCPWEDENVSPSDGTFVKTYATLGYL